MSDMPDWLTPQELAARWRLSDDTILRHLHQPQEGEPVPAGAIPAMRIGRLWRISKRTVLAAERAAEHTRAVRVRATERRMQRRAHGVDHFANSR